MPLAGYARIDLLAASWLLNWLKESVEHQKALFVLCPSQGHHKIGFQMILEMLNQETRLIIEGVLPSYNVVVGYGSHTLISSCTRPPVVCVELLGHVLLESVTTHPIYDALGSIDTVPLRPQQIRRHT